ncbi:Serine/threonine-protein kinase ULK1 [Bagarius yarrelli]|uniref:non-specific serine/threonine protein kinase n=1 Tax=Bagarius yarrelli TaxID=175774 RepID=A0A556TUC7_BAGYA|nr:Serine/threonine-protein kinase ULK1 [Bagarius yarrelli]
METVGKFEFSRKDLIGHGAFAVVFKGRHREIYELCTNSRCYERLQAKGIIHGPETKISCCLPIRPNSHTNNTCIKIGKLTSALPGPAEQHDGCHPLGSPVHAVSSILASSPQDLRLFYEKNKNLSPNIPRETSSHLRHLLLGLLQRNHKDRMDFDEFFKHPFLETSSTMKKSSPVTLTCFPSSGSASSCSSSSTSHLASPPQSLGEIQQNRAKALASPTQDSPGFLLKDSAGGGGSSKNSSCDTDDFVMVPAHFPSELTCEMPSGKVLQDSLMYSGRPPEHTLSNCSSYGQSVPIPVPTQIHNYQRIEQNLHSPSQDSSPRCTPVRRCSSGSPLSYGRTGRSPPHHSTITTRRLSVGGIRPLQLSPQAPQLPDAKSRSRQHGLGSRLHSAPCLLEAAGGCRQTIRKQHSDPVVAPQGGTMALRPLHSSPRLSELMQRSPLPTILGSPSRAMSPFEFPKPPSSPNMVTFLTQQGLVFPSSAGRPCQGESGVPSAFQPEDAKDFRRSQSSGRLSDMLLMAAFGGQLGDRGSMENLSVDRAIDTAAPTTGGTMVSGSPARVVFTVGSPPSGGTPPHTSRSRKFSACSSSSVSPVGSLTSRFPQTGMCSDGFEVSSSPRYSLTDHISANLEGAVMFEAPELPEETLMEQEHTDILQRLRFMLEFARCMVEVAALRNREAGQAEQPSTCLHQQESIVADQISSLSREWRHGSYAEQLVLYMKTAELLSTALHTAMEGIEQGKLYPSTTVKQDARLERFFSRKHRLMDHINTITAERLIFSHTVQMVQAAALDEMFHQGESSVQRYHKALLLMEGLSLLLTEQADILSVSKCKQCIERRLTALQSGLCV